jgi:hypothetical protein
MNPNVPHFISYMFVLITAATVYMVYYGVRLTDKKIAGKVLLIIIAWLILTGILSASGFYLEVEKQPIRFFLAAPAIVLTIIILFIIPSTRKFLKGLSLEVFTYLSAIRIPVEITLWWLYLYNQIPVEMTFEGRNFDILAGITAPIIAYFVFTKKKWSTNIAYTWNIVSLLLLVNIIAHAFLSLPTPFQQLAFENPNWGILYFPYLWLASFVAPVVLFTHLVSIYQLRKGS